MTGSEFKICDFGFGLHTLVVLNLCGYRETIRNARLLYVRVLDERGAPVEGAHFSPWYTVQVPQTDSFGRYQGLFMGTYDVKVHDRWNIAHGEQNS